MQHGTQNVKTQNGTTQRNFLKIEQHGHPQETGDELRCSRK